jgi:hypothetical protein
VAFYINNIHYKEADQQTYCGTNYTFKAETNIPVSTDVTYPRWYFNGVERTTERGKTEWSTTLSPNTYNIKLEVKSAASAILEYPTTITVGGVPAISPILHQLVCEGNYLNLAPPAIIPNGTITDQGWQLETGFWSNTYTNITMPYLESYSDNGKRLRYYATTMCGTSYSNEVSITVNPCASIQGTVFPFFYYNTPELDNMFTVVALLIHKDLINESKETILASKFFYIDTAKYYDGSAFIPNTPKYPGYLGYITNPGLSIDWNELNINENTSDGTSLLQGETPTTPVGMYKFKAIPVGNYVLVLYKEGYVTRFAEVSVTNGQEILLNHRELIPGDLNNDHVVNGEDLEILLHSQFSFYGDPLYNPKYDLNGDLKIDMTDKVILKVYNLFNLELYENLEADFSSIKTIIKSLIDSIKNR